MSVTPLVSVITPLFDSGSTVMRCLQSVADASRRAKIPVEHVVVFDGQDESARGLVDGWRADSMASLHVLERAHAGIAAARNSGLDAASGNLVTLLDADDEMTVARLTAARESQGESILIGRQKIVDSRSRECVEGARERGRFGTHQLSSMVLPRTWLQEVGGFDTAFRLGDDWDVVIRLREAGHRVDFRDDVFVIRHIGDHNASHDTHGLAADYIGAIRSHRRRRVGPPS